MTPPTDLELMMYFDGELDELRCSEVRAFLTSSGGARAKLDGLSLVADLMRENALSSSVQAESIVDDVMKKVETPGALKIGLASRSKDDEDVSARTAPDALEMGQPRSTRSPRKNVGLAPAANDNGKLIYGLSAFAAAAAAALFLWGRTPPGDAPTAAGTQTVLDAPLEPQPAPSVASTPTATAQPVEAIEDEQPSAEVASVDFGSRAGAVYYVSGDNTGSHGQGTTTTVVWLTDE